MAYMNCPLCFGECPIMNGQLPERCQHCRQSVAFRVTCPGCQHNVKIKDCSKPMQCPHCKCESYFIFCPYCRTSNVVPDNFNGPCSNCKQAFSYTRSPGFFTRLFSGSTS